MKPNLPTYMKLQPTVNRTHTMKSALNHYLRVSAMNTALYGADPLPSGLVLEMELELTLPEEEMRSVPEIIAPYADVLARLNLNGTYD